ncbi:hypothetical protein HOC54_03880 [Candidatus Peregrinibacteria bacterium]|nr:hypothetical protein [Candidatus Peregrinibacteria bacterium]
MNNYENYKKLPNDISSVINEELGKIHDAWESELHLKSFYEIESTHRVIDETFFDMDSYLELVARMKRNGNPTEEQIAFAKQMCTRYSYKNERRTRNTTINQDINVFELSPTWDEVKQYFGGYAELAKNGVTLKKHADGQYDVYGKLHEVEIAADNICYARIQLSGNLKFHNISKNEITYSGNYSVDETNFTNIYDPETNVPTISLSFGKGEYMDEMLLDISITDLIAESHYRTVSNKYSEAMILMINDMVPDQVFFEIEEVKAIKLKQKLANDESARILREKLRIKREHSETLRDVSETEKAYEYQHNPRIIYFSAGSSSFSYIDMEDERFNVGADGYQFTAGITKIIQTLMLDISFSSYLFSENPTKTVYAFEGEGDDYNEWEVETPVFSGASINVAMGYDFTKGKLPIRPFVGVGYQKAGIYLSEGDKSSEPKDCGYFFGQLMNRTFKNSDFFFGISISKGFVGGNELGSTSLILGIRK